MKGQTTHKYSARHIFVCRHQWIIWEVSNYVTHDWFISETPVNVGLFMNVVHKMRSKMMNLTKWLSFVWLSITANKRETKRRTNLTMRHGNFSHFLDISVKDAALCSWFHHCTMLQKISKCEVKAAWCGNFTCCHSNFTWNQILVKCYIDSLRDFIL